MQLPPPPAPYDPATLASKLSHVAKNIKTMMKDYRTKFNGRVSLNRIIKDGKPGHLQATYHSSNDGWKEEQVVLQLLFGHLPTWR